MKKTIFFLLSIQFAFAQTIQIFNTQTATESNLERMVYAMAQADVIFFGEQHDDSIAHVLQKQVFELLHKTYGKNTALSMEMFSRDNQPIMNEYLLGLISEKNFIRESNAWSNYNDYKPLVEYAKTHKLPIICANAAGRYANMATRGGIPALLSLPKASKENIAPLPFDTASGAYYNKIMELMGGHGSGNHPSFSMIPGQSLWDATMAWSIASFLKKNKGTKILHLNGRFHSDEKLGTVTQLKKYAPKTRIMVISAFPLAPDENRNPEKFSHLGDFIIFTQ
jgi:uncharacterized iron-regulated protein